MKKKYIDSTYVAYLLLESLYKDGAINFATYKNIVESKQRYLQEQKLPCENKKVA